MTMERFTKRTNLSTGPVRPRQQLNGSEWSFLGIVLRTNAVPAALLTDMLAEKLMRFRIKNTDVQGIPLNLDELTDPARRNAVISRIHFDATIQVHGPLAVLVITERLQRQ